MVTEKMKENAHKVTYLVKCYPKHTADKIIGLLQMPAININTALWSAQDLGLLAKPDDETGMIELLKEPEHWEFGEFERELEYMMMLAFKHMAENEIDLEENQVDEWTYGYPAHDVMIAMKRLIEREKLATYDIDDPQLDKKGRQVKDDKGEPVINVYTFYTLKENLGKEWGRKAFKKDPGGSEEKTDEK